MTISAEEVIAGERIYFTPLQIENIYTHLEWNNDPELNRFDSELPYVEEAFGDFKKRFEQMVYRPSPTARDFEIHTKDGNLIGVAYIADISAHHRHCRLGVTIGDRDCWGRGYGRESLELLLSYCFDKMRLHRVSTETFEYNAAWKKLVQDTGFKKEGVEREYLYRDEEFWDKENYALLETEYRDRSRKAGPLNTTETEVDKPVSSGAGS